MDKTIKGVVIAAVVLAIATASFAAGMVTADFAPFSLMDYFVMRRLEKSAVERAVTEVDKVLEEDALRPPTETSLTVGAVSGVLDSMGDPYALYFDTKHYQYFSEQNKGEFYGIGVTLTDEEKHIIIVSVIEGTPAERAGLKVRDEIVTVNGESRDPWLLEQVVARVRGPRGTTVALGIKRQGEDEVRKVVMKREKIDLPNVMKRMIGRKVGYVRALSFNEKAATEIRAALKKLDSQGAKGFVLDLRGNPGGLLQVSVDVASLFVKEGAIVRIDSRTEPEEIMNATGDIATSKPLVVLIDGSSASASEIVAGALQDHGRATIVGEKSFGKGSVQTVKEMSFGGAIKFTTARYLTPKKRVIDHRGVVPDVEVKLDPKKQKDAKTDAQLDRAVEILLKKLVSAGLAPEGRG